MYLSLKLALNKLLRSPGSYIFQGIVLFILLFITFVAILINNGAAKGILKVNGDFCTEVRLTPDNASSKDSFYLTESFGNRYTGLKYVKSHNYHFSVDVKSDLEYPGAKTAVVRKDENKSEVYNNIFTLMGDSDSANLSDFKKGKLGIISGRLYSEDDVKNKRAYAVVSEQFAQSNNLEVGSTFKIYSDNSKKELQIVGIFDTATSSKETNTSLYADKIYVPLAIAQEFRDNRKMSGDVLTYISYFLDKHDQFAMLSKEITLNEKRKVIMDIFDSDYKSKAELLKKVQIISWAFIIGGIIGSILYILLHIYFALKKRTYEIGVFYTMGLTRWIVFKQLIIELILVSVIAVVTAGTLSINEADRISRYVQNVCIKQTENLDTVTMYKMNYIEVEKAEPSVFTVKDYGSEKLTVTIETKAGLRQWGLFFAAAVVVILFGFLATALNVLKYNPIEDFQKSNGGV